MPRPPLSRPLSDLENDPPTAYNVSRHGPTNRKLFSTPTPKTPSPSPTYLLTRDSITRRFYKHHDHDRTPVKTPLPRRPSHAPSTARRPKITRLDATPSVNRTLHGSAPDRWRARQVADLTAWLNHELAATSDAATLPLHQVASSVVFLNQFAAINAIYRSKNVHHVLARVTTEICAGRLNVSKTIKLATFLKERDHLISLLLLNYHPHWLLLALSVVVGANLASHLDDALENAGVGGKSFSHEQVLMQALENAIRNHFLADAPSDNVASRDPPSPTGQERDRYNALILRRTLALIYLLDVAKRHRDPIIKPDPPLFRATSEMTSSTDVLTVLQSSLLHDHADIVRFLGQRGYSVTYKSAVFEPVGNLRVINLFEDLRDGTRLSKLASIMRRDHQILRQVVRIGPGHRPAMAMAIRAQNIASALNAMKECLPQNMHARFHWEGSPQEIASGSVDKTIAVLWQIVALWMQYVVVDSQNLKQELEVVKNEFRIARRNPDSPSNNVQIDLNLLADSPSKLQIIESCDTDAGDLLLMWCATLCGIYGVEIRDFTEDFRDGAVLCLILHHYCPELMRIDEINRIPAGDHRGAFAAEAEHKHVQKNLDLFMDRCQLLGTIPEIGLSAEATLAPAFRDALKQESVGRIMQLLASYLFRRMMMQKETSNAIREVQGIIDNRMGTYEMEALQEIDPVHEKENFPTGRVVSVDAENVQYLDQNHQGTSPGAQQGSSPNSLDSRDLSNFESSTEESASASSAVLGNDFPDGGSNDLSHVYTRMRHVQSRRATRPRPSQQSLERENAALVILRHYRGYRAQKEYRRLRNGVVELQSSVRGYLARREVHLLQQAHHEEVTRSEENREVVPERSLPTVTDTELPVGLPDEPSTNVDEVTRSLPVRIGQQILELVPAFRRHVMAMDLYSKRMLAHEQAQREEQAAIVIQRATRSHLAQQTKAHVEATTQETRRTWKSCAAEAAKMALRIAEDHRRELTRRYEQLFSNALYQAENRFNSEMSRFEADRKAAALEQERHAELRAVEEANFATELHRHQMAFDKHMEGIERGIQSLEARLAHVEASPLSSVESRHDEEIFGDVAQSVNRSDSCEDAIRLVFADLNTERDRADRLEKDLRAVRSLDQRAKEDMVRLQSEWEHRFRSLETDVENWRGTVLKGAVCLARTQYDLHMDELSLVRSKEEQEKLTCEEELRKGLAKFDDEEQKDHQLVKEILASLDEDTDGLKEVILAHELFLDQSEESEAQAEQHQRTIVGDLVVLGEQAKETDIAWASAAEEFDAEAEDVLCRIDGNEMTQQEDDRLNGNLEDEIQNLISTERRKDMEQRLLELIESAEERFDYEMYERREENEDILYCRREILNQLHEEDHEAAADAKEFEKDMEMINSDIDNVQDSCAELGEHLALLDSYINHLFSLSPSAMVLQDMPDVFGEEIADDAEDCSILYAQTCELMEQVYVEGSEVEDELDREDVESDESTPHSIPDRSNNFSITPGPAFPEQVGSPEDATYDVEDSDDSESFDDDITLRTRSGLYQTLVEADLEYYNGNTTHEIGVQTGSGPNSLSSSPANAEQDEAWTQDASGAEAQQSEEEQTYDSEISPSDKGIFSPTLSQLHHRDSSTYNPYSPNDMDAHQSPRLSSPYNATRASPSQMCTPDTMQESVSGGSTPRTEEGNRLHSPGPLDTLAQLALQDASDGMLFGNGFASGYEARTAANRSSLLSGQGFTPSSEVDGKENVLDTPVFSANKSSGIKVYGLRLDSPLRTWNSPIWEQESDADQGEAVDEKQETAELEAMPTTLEETVATSYQMAQNQSPPSQDAFQADIPNERALSNLSMQLNAFNIQPHRKSVESVLENPSSASKLESVMRRISIAASSSPQVESTPSTEAPAGGKGPHCDIVRTLFTLIRYCSRSDNQLKLRELGISIIRDFCVVHHRLADIMAVEECIDVLTTCVQYHRDQEAIFDPTIRILWEIALHPDGKKLIMESKDSVERLQGVNELLVSHFARERRNKDRIRQANMIVDIVRKRRAEGSSLKSMTEALHTARNQRLHSDVPLRDAHRLLGDLVEIVS